MLKIFYTKWFRSAPVVAASPLPSIPSPLDKSPLEIPLESDFGRVLVGIQIEDKDVNLLLKHLNKLNYEFFEETYNKSYHLFLS